MALLAVLWSAGAKAHDQRVALTFDDLPAASDVGASDRSIDGLLLAGLARAHATAIGFVNGGANSGPAQEQLRQLKKWRHAGLQLGNHTFTHSSPNDVSISAYTDDIARVETFTRPISRHRRLRWFRHPYLETGDSAATKRTIGAWLTRHGYRVAPVTLDSDDWLYALPYADAVRRHDEMRRMDLRAAYLDHVERMIVWARAASQALFGREIAQVMLLHDTRLEADCIDAVVAILRRNHLRPASLDQVLRDPAYRTPDPYVGTDGEDWLERWSGQLGTELPWDSYPEVPDDIRAQYDALNPGER